MTLSWIITYLSSLSLNMQNGDRSKSKCIILYFYQPLTNLFRWSILWYRYKCNISLDPNLRIKMLEVVEIWNKLKFFRAEIVWVQHVCLRYLLFNLLQNGWIQNRLMMHFLLYIKLFKVKWLILAINFGCKRSLKYLEHITYLWHANFTKMNLT